VQFIADDQQLKVEVTATKEFTGPPAPVDLSLLPERIPGLRDSPKKEGAYRRVLKADGDKVVLTANKLEVERNTRGPVYVTMGGYGRAFTFLTDFVLEKGARPSGELQSNLLRINSARYWPAEVRFPVRLEADNTPTNAKVELGIDLDDDKEYAADELFVLDGPKEEHLRWRTKADGGGIFTTTVKDWVKELDVTGVFGTRTMRLRLLQKDGKTPVAGIPDVFRNVTFDNSVPEITALGMVVRRADNTRKFYTTDDTAQLVKGGTFE